MQERKLKAVIDTNLFISGLFGKDSLSAKLQNLWINQDFILVTSVEILQEFSQQFMPKDETIRRIFRLIFRKAVITRDTYRTDRITDDPTDNKFLACALEGKADYIVSRDPHLRNLKQFHGIKIVDATIFIEKVKKND